MFTITFNDTLLRHFVSLWPTMAFFRNNERTAARHVNERELKINQRNVTYREYRTAACNLARFKTIFTKISALSFIFSRVKHQRFQFFLLSIKRKFTAKRLLPSFVTRCRHKRYTSDDAKNDFFPATLTTTFAFNSR